jgi:hypothetical protein
MSLGENITHGYLYTIKHPVGSASSQNHHIIFHRCAVFEFMASVMCIAFGFSDILRNAVNVRTCHPCPRAFTRGRRVYCIIARLSWRWRSGCFAHEHITASEIRWRAVEWLRVALLKKYVEGHRT